MIKKILLFVYGVVFISMQSFAYDFKAGISLYGAPKYAADFHAFDYVALDKPQSEVFTQSTLGTYDSFNPFIINGTAPSGIGLTFDTLLKQSQDETFSLYGLIADGVAILPDNAGVVFHINKNARFSDNSPILAEDVAFSFNLLREKGLPTYRYYYNDVENATILDNHTILFTFNPEKNNRELPLILGELPILSKAYWQNKDFSKTTLEPPISSGPYIIDSFETGRAITYTKNPHYWAWDLNVNRGFYYFNKYAYIYYRDSTVAMQAFKAHHSDIRIENEAKKWHHFLKTDLIKSGALKIAEIPHQLPSGMQGFVFNMRRPIFKDKSVRTALSLVFDVKWINQHLFYGLYRPTTSFFDNSYLKAPTVMSDSEKHILSAHFSPDEIQELENNHPLFFANNTQKYRYALSLLKKAGYTVNENGVLVDKNDTPFTFEILISSASANAWERVILPYVDNLKRIGISPTIRTVDTMQYNNRLNDFSFDMIVGVWGQSLSPGNEQRYFFHSSAKNQPGSMNYAGVDDAAIDSIIDSLIMASSSQELTTYTHILDRLLQYQQFVIPHWFTPVSRIIYWQDIKMPENPPMKGINIFTFWRE